MVWSHKKKIIFIHIPKTGGTTIEYHLKLLNKENGYGVKKHTAFQHYKWKNYKELLGDKIFSDYFKFSVVRNPIHRIISEYYWTPLHFGYKNGVSFDDFLKNVEYLLKNKRKKLKRMYYDHFEFQSDFILDENNKIKVDKLFRFENFSEISNFLKNYTDEKIKQKNKTKVQKLIPTEQQKERIYQMYKKDFINFNYKK